MATNRLIIIPEDELRELITQTIRNALGEAKKAYPIDSATNSNEQPINQKELCEWLNISVPTCLRWRHAGKIPFMKFGGNIRYSKSAVAKALERK
jgi:excisionase family DNA binding protein